VITRRDIVMIALAAFLFGGTAGLLGGVVGARMLMRFGTYMSSPMREPGPFWRMRQGGPPGGPAGPPPVLRRLERVLDLTAAQRESIGAVLTRSRSRFQALRDSLDREIDAQLTPQQRNEWRVLHPHPPSPMDGPRPGEPPRGPRPDRP